MSVFGRRRREEEAAEAAREAERRALFEQLAKRPDTVCPFLGMAADRAGYEPDANEAHRCYAFGDPAELTHEQQTRVCLERGYGNCPRYLRGVLVIPTEEIEALRRPAPPPSAVQASVAAGGASRRRVPVLVGALLLLLLVGSGVGAALFLLEGEPGPIALPTATATPAPTSGPPPPSPTPSPTPAAVTPSPTPAVVSPTPEPTPQPFDTFTHYEVSVGAGEYTLFQLSGGEIIASRTATFAAFSQARAEPRLSGETVHWQVQDGAYAGLSYLAPDSGPFRVRAVFVGPGGERRSYFLEDDELTEFPQETPAPRPTS